MFLFFGSRESSVGQFWVSLFMLKYILAFLAGFASASALYVFAIKPMDDRVSWQEGVHSGVVEAQFDIARRIPSVLGSDLHRADLLYADSPGAVVTNVFLQVKDATILVVERNGVKTLRDYDSNPKD
jgi:hypothetical protein